MKTLAQLIGGRWSGQSASNFVLTFNRDPSYDEVSQLRHILALVFGF